MARLAGWSALGLIAAEGTYLAMQVAVIASTVALPVWSVLGAGFAIAGLVKCAAALMLAALLFGRGTGAPAAPLLAGCLLVLLASTATTHAAARLDDRAALLVLEFAHQLGAALWIGGIPAFVLALGRISDGAAFRRVGARFSRLSMLGVACILASGIAMSLFYIGDLEGFYGTAYGVMVGAKIAMFAMLLGLGFGNFLVVERLRRSPLTSTIRLRRFAEAEIGIGFTLFFAAASLTSVPPAVDLTADRVTGAEIVERMTPTAPRLSSPDHGSLALSTLQTELDREAAVRTAKPSPAFVPGGGEIAPRNADDIAWSEYNHHWAGLFVVAIGILALLGQGGLRPARHWPLIFVGLAGFLALRADPEVWPLGSEGLIESLRDVEVLQHRVFVLLILAFAAFEWRVRRDDIRTGWTPLVFPLICALGGALLLTHQHAIANVKEQLLIELSHTPLALAAIGAGWARWLELRLDPVSDTRLRSVAAWSWPLCLVLIGLILLAYREA